MDAVEGRVVVDPAAVAGAGRAATHDGIGLGQAPMPRIRLGSRR